jgi:hypothetical protein
MGKMTMINNLTLEEITDEVGRTLDCLAPDRYILSRQKRERATVYTVRIRNSGSLLGVYRIEPEPYPDKPPVRYGSIHCPADETLTREWLAIVDMIFTDIARRSEIARLLPSSKAYIKERQEDVRELCFKGRTIPEIAEKLKWSVDTIKNDVATLKKDGKIQSSVRNNKST